MKEIDFWKDAEYVYTSPAEGEDMTRIQFRFPNAAQGPLIFSTWLYKHNRGGRVVGKNLEAEMLQCYIDRDLLSNRNG